MVSAVLTTLAYLVIVFPLAVVWHMKLFEPRYRAWGYFEGEPKVAVGFLSILIQGVVIAVLFPLFWSEGPVIARAVSFGLLIGVFHWTTHVLAAVAKGTITDAKGFVVFETIYLFIQFGLLAVALSVIH